MIPNPEVWAELSLSENGAVLNIQLPCNPVSSTRCIPDKTYNKRVASSGGMG